MKKNKMKETKRKKDTIVIKKNNLKKIIVKSFFVLFALICVIVLINIFINKSQEDKLYTIKNEAHLKRVLEETKSERNILDAISELALFSRFFDLLDQRTYVFGKTGNHGIVDDFGWDIDVPTSSLESDSIVPSVPKRDPDYSKTNVQIENIDEADVVKTDGNYVYSISDNKVIITEVIDENNPKVLSRIESSSSTYPMEILVNKNKLIIISTSIIPGRYSYYSGATSSIAVYDITNRSEPINLKRLEINSAYNTSRMIDNQVYIFAKTSTTGKSDINFFREYKEDFKEKEIDFSKIKHVKTNPSKQVMTFVSIDLDKILNDVNISSYLVDLETAYVSFDSIYLLDDMYSSWRNNVERSQYFKALFGFKGFFGALYEESSVSSWNGRSTKIAKYSFSEDRTNIEYKANAKVEGKILNQYSCDEKDGNLRIALNDYRGTRIKVLDSSLKEIGDTGPAAKGEDNKSVRFVGDRAYFVTYKNVDPLFAIDLSNPKNPKIMGELKIPGFSNYLHPYDDNHIIGIGMATNEEVVRDVFGRPVREKITFNGMKMTLFDISDIRNPKEKDVAYFGDSMTDSAINNNPKALLFSKEKNLIAIPVSKMGRAFAYGYTNLKEDNIVIQENVTEGYIVFDITTEGFNYKGIISHENYDYNERTTNQYIYYNVSRNPLRGIYIDNNLLTISNHLLKINKLDTLEFISNLDLITNELSEDEIGKTFIPKTDNLNIELEEEIDEKEGLENELDQELKLER